MAKQKQAKIYYQDGLAVKVLDPGKLYSVRARMKPDLLEGGNHEKWYWSKWRQVKAPSKSMAFAEGERYRDELVNGDGGVHLPVGQYARQWHETRKEQAESSFNSTGIAKPSFRTIERDEPEIRRIEHYFPAVSVYDLKAGQIEGVISSMRQSGTSEQTIFKMFKKLKQILEVPRISGFISVNPCRLVSGITEPEVSPAAREQRRITEDAAGDLIRWMSGQKLDGRLIALWIGLTEHIRLGEALALRACDLDFKRDAIHVRHTINRKGELVPAKAKSMRSLAMGPFLKELLITWTETQKREFPSLEKKWRQEIIPCGKTWDETAPVCSSYYGTHMNTANFGKWMRSLMVDRGLGHYTKHAQWVDSRGIVRTKDSGYVGPSYKSLRSFGATYLVGERIDIKTAQGHFGHHTPLTTLSKYAEQVPQHERQVAQVMDSFVHQSLDAATPFQAPDSLAAYRRIVAESDPANWPDWVRELASLTVGKVHASAFASTA